tara:strand:- start:1878 stop:2816 length:939 start_codon:yes stop_codon:yes gene_type:complete
MNEKELSNTRHKKDSFEIDFLELYNIFWKSKVKILAVSFLFTVLSAGFSLLIPNVYTSQSIVAPSDQSSKNMSSLSQFSGIASIAGVSLPSSMVVDDSVKAIQIMKSLDFFENLIKQESIFFNLMAVNDWDSDLDVLKINSKFYDAQQKKWVSNLPTAINGKPSIQTAHRKFLEDFSVSRDKTSGLIYLSFTHYSPKVAKDFLDLILLEIDKHFRLEAVKNANESIAYLEKEYDKNKINEVRLGISNLIQKQIETVTVANASSNYLFKQVSRPHVPELKSAPSRALIVILSSILSAFLSFFVIVLISYKNDF